MTDTDEFKIFLYTLDPISLENLPEHIQKQLFDLSEYYYIKNTSWGHILYNHFSKPQIKEIADLKKLADGENLFISGPMTLTKHVSRLYGKTIYIFGDYHGRDNACNEQYEPFTILDFFDIYTENIDKFIDIYIEFPYIKTESDVKIFLEKWITYEDNFLSDMKYLLSKRPNIRIHRVDLREYLNITRSNVLRKIVYGFERKLTQKDFEQFLKDYSNIDYQEMILSKPVEKQLEKITNKTLMKKILQFMANEVICDDFMYLIREGIRESIREKIPIEEVFDLYPYTKIYSTKCINFIMDIYLLARLFKTFEVEPGKFHPTEAKNVFIYAGNDHAEIYRDFLGSIGFSHENIARQFNTRCIRVFKPIVF